MSQPDLAPLRERLLGYCTHVPPQVNAGSYNLSVDFKAAVSAAKKVAAKRNVSASELQSSINTLHRYWEMK